MDKAQQYVEKWDEIQRRTGPGDREKMRRLAKQMYVKLSNVVKNPKQSDFERFAKSDYRESNDGLSVNPLVFVEPSPQAAIDKAKDLKSLWEMDVPEGREGSFMFNDRRRMPLDINPEDDLSNAEWVQWEKIRDGVETSDVESYFSFGMFDGYWLAKLDYKKNELNGDVGKVAQEMIELAQECGPYLTFSHVVIFIERPTHIHSVIDGQNEQLHNEDGLAVRFSDGFGAGYLWGVPVNRKWVETPIEEIDVREVLKIQDAEERYVVLRRVGYERIIPALGAEVIDEQVIATCQDAEIRKHFPEKADYIISNHRNSGVKDKVRYKLLSFDLDGEEARVLQMENPSEVDKKHYEGVTRDCETVMDALEYRNGTRELPLTIS